MVVDLLIKYNLIKCYLTLKYSDSFVKSKWEINFNFSDNYKLKGFKK